MLSKNKAKFIKSLQIKKYRNEYKLFLVEGGKSVLELIGSKFHIRELYVTEKFHSENEKAFSTLNNPIEVVSEKDLSMVSSFANNNSAIAVVEMRQEDLFVYKEGEWVILLDTIVDPGNLGTILRIADWYGISKVVCSSNTADCYNPKVVSATMGSYARVEVYYVDLYSFLEKNKIPVYAAVLDGKNVHEMQAFTKGGFLMMGNESEGINPMYMEFVTEQIRIPNFGKAESLNVAIATAILCDTIKRLA